MNRFTLRDIEAMDIEAQDYGLALSIPTLRKRIRALCKNCRSLMRENERLQKKVGELEGDTLADIPVARGEE